MINQDNVDRLSKDYNAEYAGVVADPALKAEVAKIVAEEQALGHNALMTSRTCRTRIHELLQSKIPMVDPPVKVVDGMKAQELMAAINGHHDQQAACHQAMWQHAEALYKEAGGQ